MRKKPKETQVASDKTFTTRVRLQNEQGDPLDNKEVTIIFRRMESDGYGATEEEYKTSFTNINGIALFEHKIIGFATMSIDTVDHDVKFGAPNDIGFVVTKNAGAGPKQTNFYN